MLHLTLNNIWTSKLRNPTYYWNIFLSDSSWPTKTNVEWFNNEVNALTWDARWEMLPGSCPNPLTSSEDAEGCRSFQLLLFRKVILTQERERLKNLIARNQIWGFWAKFGTFQVFVVDNTQANHIEISLKLLTLITNGYPWWSNQR